MNLPVGTHVKWTSNIEGVATEFHGVIEYVLHKDDTSGPRRIAAKMFPKYNRMFNGWAIPGNAEIGYLIGSANCLYMPNPASIEPVEGISEADIDEMLSKCDYKHHQKVMKRHVVNFHRVSTRGVGNVFSIGNEKNSKKYVYDKNGCLRRQDKLGM